MCRNPSDVRADMREPSFSAVSRRLLAISKRLAETGGFAASAGFGAGALYAASQALIRNPADSPCRSARTERGISARTMAMNSRASFRCRSRFPEGRLRLGLAGSPAGLRRLFRQLSPKSLKLETDFFVKFLRSCMLSRKYE